MDDLDCRQPGLSGHPFLQLIPTKVVGWIAHEHHPHFLKWSIKNLQQFLLGCVARWPGEGKDAMAEVVWLQSPYMTLAEKGAAPGLGNGTS